MTFEFRDLVSSLRHIHSGLPIERLSSRLRLGEHRSIFRGPSPDLHSIRPYDPERDPVNQIIEFSPVFSLEEDEIMARESIEQREVRLVFLCCLSSSLNFQLDNSYKQRLLLESIGYLGLTGARDRDPVGLIGFDDNIVLNEPLACGQDYIFYLVKRVYDFLRVSSSLNKKKHLDRRRGNFLRALDFLQRQYDRPCFVPIITDFVGCEELISSRILKEISSVHELIFVIVHDPDEFNINRSFGYLKVTDMETGNIIRVLTRKVRDIESDVNRRLESFRSDLNRIGIGSIVLTYGNHFKDLHKYFIKRKEMMR